MELGPKKIGYFLKPNHWVDYLLMDLCPNKIGYLLEPDHSIDFVLGFDWNSKVCFLRVEVGSKRIGHVMSQFWPRLHDVYIVINRGDELKAKAPPSIWLCMFQNWG